MSSAGSCVIPVKAVPVPGHSDTSVALALLSCRCFWRNGVLCHQLSTLYWNSHLVSCCSLVCPLLRAVCSCLSAVPGLDPAGLEPGSTSALTGATELPLPPVAAPSPALPGWWSHQLPVCTRMTFPCVNSKAPSYPRNVTLAAVQLGTAMAWVPASQLQLPPSQGIWGVSAHQAVTPTSLRSC